MSSDIDRFSLRGFLVLIIILLIISVIAFALSSIEGFLTGIIVTFIGLVLSFFRDDIKRAVGYGKSTNDPQIRVESVNMAEKLDKKIAKERLNLAKLESKFEAKPKKQAKLRFGIVEEATALLVLIDQAKTDAIRNGNPALAQHYEDMALEIETVRERYQNLSQDR